MIYNKKSFEIINIQKIKVTTYMAENRLELVVKKAQAALLTRSNHHNDITVTFGEHKLK